MNTYQNMKIITSIVCASLIGFAAISQTSRLKKADDYYNHLSYAYAAPLYERLIGSEVDSPAMKARLARSYYNLGEMDKAEQIYSEMIQSPEASKEDVFHYAQVLKQNGKYAESDQWMKKFEAMSGGDLRATSYAKNSDYLSKIKGMGDRFTIKDLAVNTAVTDFGAYPSADGKTIYFVSSRKKRSFVQREWSWTGNRFLDLFQSKPGSDQELSDTKILKRKVNSKFHEGPLCYTPDGKMVYFTRNNISKGKKHRRDGQGIQNLKMYRAKIDSEGKWVDQESIPFNSAEYSVGHPSVTKDGKTMYFVSDMPGGFGGADLYKVALNADGTFGKPENLGKQFNTEGQEMFPWIGSDGNLFFSSDGLIGLGGLDVFVAIANKAGSFSKVENVGTPVNGQHDDFAFVMMNDNKTGYFSSNRTDGKGDDDIYSFQLLKPFKQTLTLNGIVADYRSREILPGAEVILKDAAGNEIARTKADDKGQYSFELEPDKDYNLTATNSNYFEQSLPVTSKDIDSNTDEIDQDLYLEKDPGLSLYTYITDAKTNEALASVDLKITDNMTGEEFIHTLTPESGDVLKGILGKKIGDRISYNISMSKAGYFPKTVTFNYEVKNPGMIKVHEILQDALKMDKEVSDLRDMVEISPIKFDYNKFNIRPDAAAELNKIVEIMNKYPGMVIELGAHTDCRGSKAYNEKLSDQRAKASAAYIKSKISNPERIYGKGYGENRLLNGCACEGKVKSTCTEEEHQENRRTEFKVISTGANIDVKNTSPDSFDH